MQPHILRGGALGAAELGFDVLPDTATLHVDELSAATLTLARVLPMPGGPIAIVGRLGSRDADDDAPGVAHELLVLGELGGQSDPRARTLRQAVYESASDRGASRRALLR
jgi:hypothetical protein